ncbi:MAG: CU044_5270 family protein [Solirubrobacterales bacterium]
MNTDKLTRRLRQLDPVSPGELDGAERSAEATALLERIVAADPGSAADPSASDAQLASPARRRRGLKPPKLALGAVGATAIAAAILALVAGLPGGEEGGSSHRLADALDAAAAAASNHQPAASGRSYTYLKTREVSVNTTDADRRSWKVYQSTMREEWVTRDGSGRLRIVAGPSRFVDAGDRAEWEGAGRPNFLTLGFGGRTEERWLAEGMLRGQVATLPTEPAALVARLRREAELEHGELPLRAATLQLIAEDLRDPVASTALRRALYRAMKRLPGIEYLGERTDPDGRSGTAVGVTVGSADGDARYFLIFDPDTATVLATETTMSSTLIRAMVYLESRKVGSLPEDEGMSLSAFDPSAPEGRPTTSYLVYRIPD